MSRAKIEIKGKELVELLNNHKKSFIKIQTVEATQQGLLEMHLADLIIDLAGKTQRMSHKVLQKALVEVQGQLGETALKIFSCWNHIVEKIRNQRTGTNLTILQRGVMKLWKDGEGEEKLGKDGEGQHQPSEDQMEPKLRLIQIIHNTMMARVQISGHGLAMLPLMPGKYGQAQVSWDGYLINTLVANSSLPAERFLGSDVGPPQEMQEDHISPAGSSRYPQMSSPAASSMDGLLQVWQDGLAEEGPQQEEDENQAVADGQQEEEENLAVADAQLAEGENQAVAADAQQEDFENQAVADDYQCMLATPEQRTMASYVETTQGKKKITELEQKTVVNLPLQKKPSAVMKRPSCMQKVIKKPSAIKRQASKQKQAFKKSTMGTSKSMHHRLMWYQKGYLAIRQLKTPKRQLASCKSNKNQEESFKIGMTIIKKLERGEIEIKQLKDVMVKMMK